MKGQYKRLSIQIKNKMAINRLTDIVAAMKSKWPYGDKDFAYTFEVNEQHNTQYPYMMINPPNSEFPEVYGGWEAYDFEIDFFDLYQTANQNAVSLEQEWDNLQDLALEWIDNVMIHFNNPEGVNVGIYFLEETLGFERVKEVANDRLVQIKMTFTLRAVTKCLFGNINISNPGEIDDLCIWLRADSGLTYTTATKKISHWDDQSGNDNHVGQSVLAKQPLRIPYGGASNKSRVNFDAREQRFVSDGDCPVTTDFTAFTVAQSEPVVVNDKTTLSTHFETASQFVDCGNPAPGPAPSGNPFFYSFSDGVGGDNPFSISTWVNINPLHPWRGWVEKKEVGQEEYSIHTEYSTGNVLFRLYDNSTGGAIGIRVQGMVAKGEWVHVVCTYDGSKTTAGMKIYYDGSEQVTVDSNTGVYNSMQYTTSNLKIGVGIGNSMWGDMAQTSIYSLALASGEVETIYNGGNPPILYPAFEQLLGWWKMGDDAVYPIIPDSSQYNNAALMTSMDAEDIRLNAPNSERGTYFSYETETGNVKWCFGSSSERLYCHIADETASIGEWNARYIWDGDTSVYHIGMMKLDSSTANLELKYNNNPSMEGTMANYDPLTTYNKANFIIGHGSHLKTLDGNLQEVIVFCRALNSDEIDAVRNYLNNKYNIY